MAWPRPSAPAPLSLLAAAALGALLAGCAPPGRTAGPAATLFVGDGVAGTVTPLDVRTGRPVGPPATVATGAVQLAAGPGGRLLVLAIPAAPAPGAAALTQLVPSGGGWRRRPVDLGLPAYDATLAGDGGRYAVVAFHPAPLSGDASPPAGPPCRVALVDAAAGAVERTLAVCGPDERVAAAAFESSPAGLVVYLGTWLSVEEGDAAGPARGRIVALDARTGAVRASAPVDGRPSRLALAPGRSPPDARLFCLEDTPVPAYDTAAGVRSRLLALDPATLQLERAAPLRAGPRYLAVAPDGERAYLLPTLGGTVHEVDLRSGAQTPWAALPGAGAGLVATDRWVYAAAGDAVWRIDRRAGGRAEILSVGGHPGALALAPYDAP